MSCKLFMPCVCLLVSVVTLFLTGCGLAPDTAPEPKRIDPASARYEAAVERLRAGDYPGALVEVEEALHLRPGDGWALCLRGEVRLKQNDYARAAEDFAAALKALPDARPADLCRAHLGRAEALAALGNPIEANAEFDRAASADPGQREAVTKAQKRLVGTWQRCIDCGGCGQKLERVLMQDDYRPATITPIDVPNGHGGVTGTFRRSEPIGGGGPGFSPTTLRTCWMCAGKGGHWLKSAE